MLQTTIYPGSNREARRSGKVGHYGGEAMQTENPVYEEIEEILRAVELPGVALVALGGARRVRQPRAERR